MKATLGLVLCLGAAACSAVDPGAESFGTLVVVVQTSGIGAEGTTHALNIDGKPEGSVAPTSSEALMVPVGRYTPALGTPPPRGVHGVALVPVDSGCAVNADPVIVEVEAGGTDSLQFWVSCPLPPPPAAPSGKLIVEVVTTGPAQDPDGYSFTLTGWPPTPIATNGRVPPREVQSGLLAWDLSDVVMNCQASHPTSGVILLEANAEDTLRLAVECQYPAVVARLPQELGRPRLGRLNPDGTNLQFLGEGTNPLSATATSVRSPALSPDGRTVAAIAWAGGDKYTLALIDAVGTEPIQFLWDTASVWEPRWRPDGGALLFVQHDPMVGLHGRLAIRELAGGTPTTFPTAGSKVLSADWSPDGSRIAYTAIEPSDSVALYVMNANGSGVTRIWTGTPSGWVYVRWSPRGDLISVLLRTDGTEPHWLIAPDGSWAREIAAGRFLATGSATWSPDGSEILIAGMIPPFAQNHFCRLALTGVVKSCSYPTPFTYDPDWR